MQCFSELIPPTAVSHSLAIDFLDIAARNLIVVKTSLLQIFKLANSNAPDSTNAPDGTHARLQSSPRLVLVAEYPLAGVVTSLAKIKIAGTKTGGEALLVSFKDAKISLLEWDPENHRIATISIHYYEGDKVPLANYEPHPSDFSSKLVVDPRGRCAALRFASRHLAIVPFVQADEGGAALDDDFLEDTANGQKVGKVATNGTNPEQKSTPYAASFVLPLTTLDPALTHPVDVNFLFEYREPTLGIVSANKSASSALLEERKDLLTYTVITLDLDQRASTTLLSVKGLPFDVWKAIPLAPPIGGTLLVGINELIHVDQSGKTNAVAVNEFARQCSNFSMADQSKLRLRLENACIETLNADTGDLLLLLDNGDCAVLSFHIDGRTVSGLNVQLVDHANGGDLAPAAPSTTSWLGGHDIFIGSEIGDAKLLTWTAKAVQAARKRTHAEMLGEDMGFEIDEADLEGLEDEDADDDLYGEESLSKSTMHRRSKAVAPESYVIEQLDSLASLAPMNSIVFGAGNQSSKRRRVEQDTSVEVLASVGQGKSSRLVQLSRSIHPTSITDLPETQVRAAFNVEAVQESGKTEKFVVVSYVSEDQKNTSKLYTLPAEMEADDDAHPLSWQEASGTDFETEGATTNVFVISSVQRIIQIRETEVRTYDPDFQLSQILPIVDANTDEELQVIHSAFCEPYLLLLRKDSSLQILKADKQGELEELELGTTLMETKWLSACLYRSAVFGEETLAFVVNDAGALQILALSDLQKPRYSAPQLAALPAVLTSEDRQRRAATRESVSEILFADLGDELHHTPYLVVRSSTDEVTLYEPFHNPPATDFEYSLLNLKFRKVPGLHIPRYTEELESDDSIAAMQACTLAGKMAVFVPGESPSFIVKHATSLPRIVDVDGPAIKHLTPYTIGTNDEFLYTDAKGILRHARFPRSSLAISGCVFSEISPLLEGHEIHEIGYLPDRDLFALVSSESLEFHTTEEELAQQEAKAGVTQFPTLAQYSLHLLDLHSASIISSHTIPRTEIVTSLVCARLEMSEVTHDLEELITVGTMTEKADNYATKGSLYTFRIVPVVPEPEEPQKRFRLQLHNREETRAGITAMTNIGGLIATAQGQKLMLRGLREDHQNLPMAFLDFLTYTTTFKTLAGSRMWLAADTWKGMWFGGYTEEPPKMHVFGRTAPQLGLVTADFLPHDGDLYLVGVDERLVLHVWQFDPEHPKSLGGARLIAKSTFELGHLVMGMHLLPNTIRSGATSSTEEEAEPEDVQQQWQVLTTSRTGQVGIITPLDEQQYRRLSTLQGLLTNVLEHPAGLNPKAYRNIRGEDGGGGGSGKGVVDGDLIRRLAELGAGRRSEIVSRAAGGGWWEVRGDLEVISGRGLSYI